MVVHRWWGSVGRRAKKEAVGVWIHAAGSILDKRKDPQNASIDIVSCSRRRRRAAPSLPFHPVLQVVGPQRQIKDRTKAGSEAQGFASASVVQDRPRDHIHTLARASRQRSIRVQGGRWPFCRCAGHVAPAPGHVIQALAEAGTRVPGCSNSGAGAFFGAGFDVDKCSSFTRSLLGALLTLGLGSAVFSNGRSDRFEISHMASFKTIDSGRVGTWTGRQRPSP